MTKLKYILSTGYCNQQRGRTAKSGIFFILIIFYLTLWGIPNVKAQQASIQGIITDSASGQPLEGANILLKNLSDETLHGIATDGNGFYQIGNIHPDTYLLRITFVGHMPYEDTLSLKENDRQNINISLQPDTEELEEVVVSLEQTTQVEAGRQQLSASDLGRVPTPAGSGDLASYIQTLPGVVSTGDRGGQLFIRGGTPTQNMVLVDGTLIYKPFHILGFFSVFPEKLVSGADFYAGGFGSQYAGRISSVIDVKMKDGDRNNTKGSASLSPLLGEIVVEGPLKKGKSSWIASTRRSLIEQTSPTLLGEEQPLHFESQYLKMSFFGEGNSRCSMMGMHTYDRGKLDPVEDDIFNWRNMVFGGRCVVLPEESDLLFDMNAGISHIANGAGSAENPERFAKATRFNLDIKLTQYSGSIRFDYGGFLHVNSLNYDMSEQFGGPQTGSELFPSLGTFVQSTIPIGNNVEAKPGLVLSYHRHNYPVSLEPRFRLSWQPWGNEEQSFHAAVGRYLQPITGVTGRRDAGSIFTAWMPSPVGNAQMEAIHFLAGWNQSWQNGLNISAEAYYKKLDRLPVSVWSNFARFTTDLAMADGVSYGSDLRLEYARNSLHAFIGYGYSHTEYETRQEQFEYWFGTSSQKYHPSHDRRHQLTAQLNLDINSFSAAINWQFGSGLPFSSPMGFDELLRFEEKLPDVKREHGTTRVIIEKPNNARMPSFHRLDLSLKRSFHFQNNQLTLRGGAINTYNQTNLFYYDVYNHQQFNQLPFLPYLAVNYEFQ
ncbi:TonB-dependent receptor [Aliifodinibius salicampi]|uniref:TonB-dependent receptor n=1 Tax=Fodinibius salicampi TaxID=1920655 RepID=A0ABT3Q0P1_9BACT|nr:TonB-dependent receptor [Fodinibius salicampi]MCW9713651.1 TonB-dependent receptor [Fodinibius salicampi]